MIVRSIGRRLGRLIVANKRIVILAACAIVFVALLEDVLEGDLSRIDSAAYALIVERLRADWLTPIMEAVSALATPVSLVVLLLVIVAFAPGKRPGACAAVNLVLVFLLNQALKFAIQRPRPDGFQLAVEQGFSFPSGHSMVAMAFFGLLVWTVWRYEADRATRIGCAVAFSAVIVLVGVSRIYLGVHYASDVLAGFCVSLAWLAIYTRVAAPLFLGPAPGRKGGETSHEAA
ncbi:MAG TPA: phosphatase PAP2 family protein [Candidatus Aphodovivens excrementavium]|nr:phosphatase PAP2 family protein [Candidatus Aphodovivens excrementavium]